MKKVSLLLAFLTLLTLNTIARNSKEVVKVLSVKQFNKNTKISLNANTFNVPTYVWAFDGDCLQLYSIEESSYIDNSGMAHPSYLVREMNTSNCTGMTTRICPPAGNSYC